MHESEAHLIDAVNDRLHRPPVELACVVSDFLVEHHHGHLVEFLGPALALVVPLEEHEKVRETLGACIVMVVVLTTDANFEALTELVDLIPVANSEHFLILSFLMGIVSFKLGKFLFLSKLKQVSVHLGSLLHKLSCTVDGVIVDGGVIGQSCLRDSLAVEHVLSTFLISLINKEHLLELLDADVPRVDCFRRAHDSDSCLISDEDVGLLFSCNLLDVFIVDDRSFLPVAFVIWDFPWTRDSALLELHVERVHLARSHYFTKDAWSQVEKLILSLL